MKQFSLLLCLSLLLIGCSNSSEVIVIKDGAANGKLGFDGLIAGIMSADSQIQISSEYLYFNQMEYSEDAETFMSYLSIDTSGDTIIYSRPVWLFRADTSLYDFAMKATEEMSNQLLDPLIPNREFYDSLFQDTLFYDSIVSDRHIADSLRQDSIFRTRALFYAMIKGAPDEEMGTWEKVSSLFWGKRMSTSIKTDHPIIWTNGEYLSENRALFSFRTGIQNPSDSTFIVKCLYKGKSNWFTLQMVKNRSAMKSFFRRNSEACFTWIEKTFEEKFTEISENMYSESVEAVDDSEL